jgi:hypothetical protein
MKMRPLLIIALVIVAMLVFTNPTEEQYRAHVLEREGIAGGVGLLLADVLGKGRGQGIHRENFYVASRFYAGGDGILPRQDLAWGVAGKFIEIEHPSRQERP